MNVYWNPETRCAIATTGELAVFCIVPVDMDPIYWCEEVFCLKNGIHTPYAFCRLIPIHPLTGIPPIRIAPEQTEGSEQPASDMEDAGGGTATPAPLNTPSQPPDHGASDASITSSPTGPVANDVTPRLDGPSLVCSGAEGVPGTSLEPIPSRSRRSSPTPPGHSFFGVSIPYGGRY